jgi:hypothetical protein
MRSGIFWGVTRKFTVVSEEHTTCNFRVFRDLYCLPGFHCDPDDGGSPGTCTRLHGITSQKKVLFIVKSANLFVLQLPCYFVSYTKAFSSVTSSVSAALRLTDQILHPYKPGGTNGAEEEYT